MMNLSTVAKNKDQGRSPLTLHYLCRATGRAVKSYLSNMAPHSGNRDRGPIIDALFHLEISALFWDYIARKPVIPCSGTVRHNTPAHVLSR